MSDPDVGRAGIRHFPFTIGAFFVLSLWLQRTSGAADGAFGDLFTSLLAVWAVAAVTWGLALMFRADATKRAMLAFTVAVASVLYGSIVVVLYPALGSSFAVLPVWTLGVLLIVLLIVRSPRDFSGAAMWLNRTGLLLLVIAAPGFVRAVRTDDTATAWTDARRADRPDIYIIVPDKYSGREWLAETYGLNRKPFEDSLRALGFVVPQWVRANYSHTKLSLPTFLAGEYVSLPEHPDSAVRYDDLEERIRHSPLWSELDSLGYRVTFFPSTFSGSREIAGADLVIETSEEEEVGFAETWWVNSPLVTASALRCVYAKCNPALTTPFPIESIETNEWKFDELAALPDSAGPIAAFLHVMLPHEPFLYADDCSPREPWWPLTDAPPTDDDSLRAAYAAQVRCLDAELLKTVREIIARSDAPPVIIIQSDHGNARIATNVLRGVTKELDELTEAQVGERLTVFGAYRFPGADTLIYDGISPVNVMPAVRAALFSMPLVRRADRSFWSTYQRAMDFTEIAPERLRP